MSEQDKEIAKLRKENELLRSKLITVRRQLDSLDRSVYNLIRKKWPRITEQGIMCAIKGIVRTIDSKN